MLQFRRPPSAGARARSLVAGVGAAAGAVLTVVSCERAADYHNPPIGNVATNMEKASAELSHVLRNPTDTDALVLAGDLIGDQGTIDDRLNPIEDRTEALEPGQPIPQSDLIKIEGLRNEVKKLGEEYRTASHNHAEKYVFIFGGLTIGAIGAWVAVQFAEHNRQEREYN